MSFLPSNWRDRCRGAGEVDIGNSNSLRLILSPGGKTNTPIAANLEKCIKSKPWLRNKLPLLWPACAASKTSRSRAAVLSTGLHENTDKDLNDFQSDFGNL